MSDSYLQQGIAGGTRSPLRDLVEELDNEGIDYCHWKGNSKLSEIMDGTGDFELFTRRSSLAELFELLNRNKFKLAKVRWPGDARGVRHFLGMNSANGELAHIHHYNVVSTGLSFAETHVLPLDRLLVEGAATIDGVRIPRSAVELVHLALRQAIRDCSWINLLVFTKPHVIHRELNWLLSRTSVEAAEEELAVALPVLPRDLFRQYVLLLGSNRSSGFERRRLARKIKEHLACCSSLSPAGYWSIVIGLIWRRFCRWLAIAPTKTKQLESGGSIIAFVGPEATGKSTLAGAITSWLGQELSVRSVHVGKPPPTLLTAPFRLALPLARGLFSRYRTARVEGHVVDERCNVSKEEDDTRPPLIYSVRATLVAWERSRLLRKVQRWAAGGDIVVCDRYPSSTTGAMDSARLTVDDRDRGLIGRLKNWLARVENDIYRKLPAPDVVFSLKVPVDVAVERNRTRIKTDKESASYVMSRHALGYDWCRPGTGSIVKVETSDCRDKTIMHVKTLLWNQL